MSVGFVEDEAIDHHWRRPMFVTVGDTVARLLWQEVARPQEGA